MNSLSVMLYGVYGFRKRKYGGMAAALTRTFYPNFLKNVFGSAQVLDSTKIISSDHVVLQSVYEEATSGLTIGQRIGLSHCDELKIRRFYSEPGIRGGKKCQLWTPR